MDHASEGVVNLGHWVSACCKGERCRICGLAASHEVEEKIRIDAPNPGREAYSAYLCCGHFALLFGGHEGKIEKFFKNF